MAKRQSVKKPNRVNPILPTKRSSSYLEGRFCVSEPTYESKRVLIELYMDTQNPFPPYKPARYVKLKNGRRYIEYYVWNACTQKLQRVRDYSIERECANTREREQFAKAFIKTINDALRKGAHLTQTPDKTKARKRHGDTTLIEHMRLVVQAKGEAARPSTQRAYNAALLKFEKYLAQRSVANLKPKELNGELMHGFQDWLLSAKYNNKTVNSFVGHIKAFLNALVEREILEKNPSQKVKLLKTTTKAHRYFSAETQAQIEEWLRANDLQLYRFTRFIYFCFIRPKELYHLRVRDVDFSTRRIMISGEVSKNHKAQYVAIPSSLWQDLQNWGLTEVPQDYYLFGKDLKPSRFKSGENAAYNRNVTALEAFGLHGQGYDLYSWKHTGVVNAYKAGVDIKALKEQGRHHSLEMTDIYLRGLGLSTSKVLEEKEW